MQPGDSSEPGLVGPVLQMADAKALFNDIPELGPQLNKRGK